LPETCCDFRLYTSRKALIRRLKEHKNKSSTQKEIVFKDSKTRERGWMIRRLKRELKAKNEVKVGKWQIVWKIKMIVQRS
jgi:hypothetical protein